MWIKQVGCGCPECGPDPCSDGCACSFRWESESASGDDTLDVTGQFLVDQTISIFLALSTCAYYTGGFHATPSRVFVYANGSLIYDSGCITSGISTTITVPAGTTSLRIVNDYDCSGVCESGGDGNSNAFFDCA